jgi:hypothetical protein
VNRRRAVGAALAATCLIGPLGPAAHAAGQPEKERPTPGSNSIVVHDSDRFDWGDAAIGAATGVGASLAAAGAVTLARNK